MINFLADKHIHSQLVGKISCIYPPRVPNYVIHVKLFNAPFNYVNVPFNYVQGTRGGYIHELSAFKLHTVGLVVGVYMRSLPK